MRTLRLLVICAALSAMGLAAASCASPGGDSTKTEKTDTTVATPSPQAAAYEDSDCKSCHDAANRPQGTSYDDQLTRRGKESAEAQPSLELINLRDDSPVTPDGHIVAHYRNFKMSAGIGGPDFQGEGHMVWSVDGGPPLEGVVTTLKLQGLARGEHTVKAKLQQNSRAPLDPPVEMTKTFTVE